MKKKYGKIKLFSFLLIILITFQNINVLSQDLEYPSSVDGGLCEIGIIKSEIVIPKYKYFQIKNISQEDIYLLNFKITKNYSSKILNGISNGWPIHNNLLLKSKDSIQGLFTFFYLDLDSLTKLGKELTGNVIFYYRKFSSDKIDSIQINFSSKGIIKNEVKLNCYKYSIYIRYKDEDLSLGRCGIGEFTNQTKENYLVDSINFIKNSDNLSNFIVLNNFGKKITLPYEVKDSSFIYFKADYQIKKVINDSCIVKLFAREKSTNKNIILLDTFIQPNKLLKSPEFVFYTNFNYQIKKLNDTCYFGLGSFNNQTDSNWTLKNINIENKTNFNITKSFCGLPFSLIKYSNEDIGSFKFKCTEIGEYTFLAFLTLENNQNEVVEHSVLFHLTVTPPTDIKEENANYNGIIYPNPASELIEISLDAINRRVNPTVDNDLGVSLEFFNIYGEKIPPRHIALQNATPHTSTSSVTGNLRIDISNLVPGVYFIKIGNQFEKFVKM